MKIARRIAAGLIVAVIGVAVAACVQLHRDGYRAYIIHTGSMTGTYNSGGLVIDRPVGTSPLQIGQTITYLHAGVDNSDVITHRIVGLSHGTIRTKGDANKIRDTWKTSPDQVRGVVVSYLPYMGYVVYFLKHRTGDLSVVTGLLTLILLWDLFFAGASLAETTRRMSQVDDVPTEFPFSPTGAAGDLSPTYHQAFNRLRSGTASSRSAATTSA